MPELTNSRISSTRNLRYLIRKSINSSGTSGSARTLKFMICFWSSSLKRSIIVLFPVSMMKLWIKLVEYNCISDRGQIVVMLTTLWNISQIIRLRTSAVIQKKKKMIFKSGHKGICNHFLYDVTIQLVWNSATKAVATWLLFCWDDTSKAAL